MRSIQPNILHIVDGPSRGVRRWVGRVLAAAGMLAVYGLQREWISQRQQREIDEWLKRAIPLRDSRCRSGPVAAPGRAAPSRCRMPTTTVLVWRRG